MATFPLSVSPNLTLNLDFNGTNGKVNGLTAVNIGDHDVRVIASLSNGDVIGRVFGPGTQIVNFPANLVSITFDSQGEPTFVGLLKVEANDPAP